MALGGVGSNAVKVGIGTPAPAAELHVEGYSKLGPNSPNIQLYSFSTTASNVQGGTAVIMHSINPLNVISVTVVARPNNNEIYCHGYTTVPGYEFDFSMDGARIFINNSAANSANILNAPVTVLVTVQQ
jgi:hypothetical protein